jgi:hypothetical protein
MKLSFSACFIFLWIGIPILFSQTGSIHEPVRYVGGETIDPKIHEGRLRCAIGVESRQTVRVNRTHPEMADGCGWTYSHASNLCYWNDTFYQQYLSNPIDEHIAPGQTLITTSKNGRVWSKPKIVFPPYKASESVKVPEGYNGYMMHQRMGFYVSPNNRLLVLAFYGHAEDPFRQGGIGRVVREAYKDGSYGPIYFIRYTSHAGWNEKNTSYPFYKKSKDRGFVQACEALVEDKLVTKQWWDEDRGLDGFYTFKRSGSALSYYHRKDGNIVALWKRSLCALSFDDGITFSKPVRVPTLTMAGGKIWGQGTDDGRYAMFYNPIELDEYRYPLIVVTSDDGIIYDNMLIVQGEVPPRKFYGRWKDFGPCYTRGILEGNGNPPSDDIWITYSMNKEDMWVSRIPLPVRYKVNGAVQDNFDDMQTNGAVTDWNVYAPKWAPINIVEFPNASNKSLQLKDGDPYDYARAIRVVEDGKHLEICFRIYVLNAYTGTLDVEITDRFGNRPVRLCFDDDGKIKAFNGARQVELCSYQLNQWHDVLIKAQALPLSVFSVVIDGKAVLSDANTAVAVKSMERISYRTGPYRNQPNRRTPNQIPGPPLEDCDDLIPPAMFYIDEFSAKIINK